MVRLHPSEASKTALYGRILDDHAQYCASVRVVIFAQELVPFS